MLKRMAAELNVAQMGPQTLRFRGTALKGRIYKSAQNVLHGHVLSRTVQTVQRPQDSLTGVQNMLGKCIHVVFMAWYVSTALPLPLDPCLYLYTCDLYRRTMTAASPWCDRLEREQRHA
jgi:hypothetical protein